MRTIEEDIEIDRILSEVRRDRLATERDIREKIYGFPPLNSPHAFEEFRMKLGRILGAPTGMPDWRERIVECAQHMKAEREDFIMRMRWIRSHLDKGELDQARSILDLRFPAHDAFGWNANLEDNAKAHELYEASRKIP